MTAILNHPIALLTLLIIIISISKSMIKVDNWNKVQVENIDLSGTNHLVCKLSYCQSRLSECKCICPRIHCPGQEHSVSFLCLHR